MSDVLVASLGAVIVATITAIPVTISALTNRRRIESIHTNIGEKNGNGDLMTMGTRILDWQSRHEAEDRHEFALGRERFAEMERLLNDATPMFTGLTEELTELNHYSHERNHRIIGGLTVLASWVQTMWNEMHPDEPLDFEEMRRALDVPQPEVPNP